MLCIFPLTLSKILILIALVVIINFSWRTLDRARSFILGIVMTVMTRRRMKQMMAEEDDEERIEHILDILERNRAWEKAEQGDGADLKRYWDEHLI
ncbi:hypothetical protein ACFL6S_00700 [Candidatus Poribacteria bacterium]